jgi:hypothetical protein
VSENHDDGQGREAVLGWGQETIEEPQITLLGIPSNTSCAGHER